MDDVDICYECEGYEDYYDFDDTGNLVCICADCWVRKRWSDDLDNDDLDN